MYLQVLPYTEIEDHPCGLPQEDGSHRVEVGSRIDLDDVGNHLRSFVRFEVF